MVRSPRAGPIVDRPLYAGIGAICRMLARSGPDALIRDYGLVGAGQVIEEAGFGGNVIFAQARDNQAREEAYRARAARDNEKYRWTISDQEQKRIAQVISELEEAVRAEPGMDSDLRIFLLYHAAQVRHALSDIPLRGRGSLEDAYDQAVGAAYRRMDMTSRAQEQHPGTWEKFRDVMVVIAAVLTIATSSLALPGQIRQELEGPPPAAPPIVTVIEQPPTPPDAPAPQVSSNGDVSDGRQAAR